MADRIPLIVNPTVSQIQELPNADDLVLSGQLKMTGTTSGASDINLSGGTDAKSVITVTETTGTLSQLSIDCRNNGNSADVQVGEFKVGASDKIEFRSYGEITAVQPSCLLTVPINYTAENTVQSGGGHEGGQNFKPIAFTNETTRVGCTTSLASDPAQGGTSGITSITVPSAGTYLVSAMIGGAKLSGSGTDQIRFGLSKSGVLQFPNELSHPTFIFGDNAQAEFNCTFTLPLTLSASDTLSVHLSHIGASTANIQEGYFSVTKLH